ncbi:g6634 [Coccomyxa elongata]
MKRAALSIIFLLGIFSPGICASTPEDALIKWIRRCGGTVDLDIATVNDEGLRGTVAVRDMNKSQIAVHLPAHLAVELGEGHVTSEENAIKLLRLQMQNQKWNQSMLPYWESLPRVGASLTKQTYPAEPLDLLQDRTLAASIVVHGAYTKNVYDGGKPSLVEDFQAEFPGVSYQTFSHLTSLVSSYAFLFPDEGGVARRMMLPLVDMMNHGDGSATNVEIMQADNGDLYAYTLREIAKGEELVHEYNTGIARNDQSLFHYGFVREHDPPRLVAQDMPAGNLYDPTFYTEDDYEFGGRLVTKAELARLEGILRSFPTTEREDAQILAGKSGGGWGSVLGGKMTLTPLERMFVKYRLLRKQALAHIIQKLKDTLLITTEL